MQRDAAPTVTHRLHTHSPAVAITGLGLICPLGNSVREALARARRGESGIRRYTSPWVGEPHPELRERVGGTVMDFRPADDALAARHEPATMYALAAAA